MLAGSRDVFCRSQTRLPVIRLAHTFVSARVDGQPDRESPQPYGAIEHDALQAGNAPVGHQ